MAEPIRPEKHWPAFPCRPNDSEMGLTKFEFIATQLHAGMLANGVHFDGGSDPDRYAQLAVDHAEALCKTLYQRPKKRSGS